MVTVFVVSLPLKTYSLSMSKSMPQREAVPWVFISTVPLKRLPWNDRSKSGSSHSWFRKLKLIYQGYQRTYDLWPHLFLLNNLHQVGHSYKHFQFLKNWKLINVSSGVVLICTFRINHSIRMTKICLSHKYFCKTHPSL